MIADSSPSVLPNLRKGFLNNIYHVIDDDNDDDYDDDDLGLNDESNHDDHLRQKRFLVLKWL